MRIEKLVSSSLAALVVCSLELTTLAGGRDPVTRPFRVKGDLALIVSQDPTTLGETVGFGKGEGSHEGRFVVHAAGSYDFETGNFIGEGILTTANGDLIYFKMRNLGWVEFTGGTGRFENVTGGHTIEPTATPEQKEVDGQLIVSLSLHGPGHDYVLRSLLQ